MFDPKKHMVKVQGNREYLPVSARLVWFREEHPDWGIVTRAVAIDLDKQYAIFEASIFNADGKLMSMGTKMENVKGFGDYLEKAETGSVGRALALCGFGTQFAPEIDDGIPDQRGAHIVDSPARADQPPSRQQAGRNGGNNYLPANRNHLPTSTAPHPSQVMAASDVDGPAPEIEEKDPFADEFSPDGHPPMQPHQAATHAPHPAHNGGGVATATDPTLVCQGCGLLINEAQKRLSEHKYNASLCPSCQKEQKGVK